MAGIVAFKTEAEAERVLGPGKIPTVEDSPAPLAQVPPPPKVIFCKTHPAVESHKNKNDVYCCGLGGWTRGLLEVGYHVIGFDVEYFAEYPGQLVIQDIRTVSGSRFRQAALIVASPPCQEFSRHDQPWTRKYNPPPPDLSIIQACWRIAAEAGVPFIMENVRGAQKFIGKAPIHYGSQYLWGDIPALLPIYRRSLGKNFYWWGKPGDQQADIPNKKNKESRSSKAVAERSLIPIELAKHIGRVFLPRGQNV